jgi:quercetin dioxygenase-like cupin family protein
MTEYPEIITSLPQADIPFKGLQGWLLQGECQQLVFLEIEPIGKVSEHTHSAQFGVVLDGEMTLTIGGVAKTYRRGDAYFIPEGVSHSAEFPSKVFALDLFNEPERYRAKR